MTNVREVYRATTYKPELVTGRYIRVIGRKGEYRFRVFETATGTLGQFRGKPGMGPTLREYDTDGDEIPADLRAKAIQSKNMEKWD